MRNRVERTPYLRVLMYYSPWLQIVSQTVSGRLEPKSHLSIDVGAHSDLMGAGVPLSHCPRKLHNAQACKR